METSRSHAADWYKTNDVSAYRSTVASPKPKVSNISCLSGGPAGGAGDTPSRARRDDESDFVKLCREGGHKGLLQIQENTRSDKPVEFKRNGGDWYYTEDKLDGKPSRKGNEHYEKELAKAHVQASEIRESDYIKLAKAGGDPNLLKIVENKPAATRVQSNKSNPIWCGGEGNEAKTTPGGKRVVPRTQTAECPFASHY